MGLSWLSQREGDLPSSDAWLAPAERERAAGMRYAKRRNDYLLGRWTAKRALAAVVASPCDPPSLAAIEVRNRESGAPFALVGGAPSPLAISITDRAGVGVCAVETEGHGIGCDLELVEPRSPAFLADYLTEPERRAVERAPAAERDVLANLTWSAKESALKVLRTGLRRDTRSVEIELRDESSAGWSRLVAHTEDAGPFPGWWRRYGPFLLTFAAEREGPPPAGLVEPPALEDAVPTHTWLADPLVSRT